MPAEIRADNDPCWRRWRMPDWRQCEGELAGGEYPLERYLGGSEGRAVFLTRFASGRAAIKLAVAGQAQVGELVERWNRAANLYHPHLVRIFAAGTWALGGMPLAYLVMEYAEENLEEVLRERPLSTDETREMLEPVADALAYLHGQGLVHGNLKPSNILAVEDTVKISSEAVSAGDPARRHPGTGSNAGTGFNADRGNRRARQPGSRGRRVTLSLPRDGAKLPTP